MMKLLFVLFVCLPLQYDPGADLTNVYLKTLVPETGISGRDLHPTVFFGMQLFIPAWDTSFWHQSPHLITIEIRWSSVLL